MRVDRQRRGIRRRTRHTALDKPRVAAFGACLGDAAYNIDADFNRSGCVDLTDLSIALSVFGTRPIPRLHMVEFTVTRATAFGFTTDSGDVVGSGSDIILFDASVGSFVAHRPFEFDLLPNDDIDALESKLIP